MSDLRCSLILWFSCCFAICCGLLFPQENELRQAKSLNGFWRFKFDPDKHGVEDEWFCAGLPDPVLTMPVPSSFNDLTNFNTSLRHYLGDVWYQTEFWTHPGFVNGNRVPLRFAGAHYNSSVWVNGQHIMEHEGGHLPFDADVTSVVRFNKSNVLVVRVNNILGPTSLPPGDLHSDGTLETWFDFLNYAGIDRPVTLYTTKSTGYIDAIAVETLNISWASNHEPVKALVGYNITIVGHGSVSVKLLDSNGTIVDTCQGAEGMLSVPNPILWHPCGTPARPSCEENFTALYTLDVTLFADDGVIDMYTLTHVGIRTIRVTSTQLLVNEAPVYLHGFGKHEDADWRGKGHDPVLIAKDMQLMNWINANSFRTSHYPYAEDWYYAADVRGILIIGECPAVGLVKVWLFNPVTLGNHLRVMSEMISRDRNHPSVIMWSVANEPGFTDVAVGYNYFSTVINHTRALDGSRPVTLVTYTNYGDPMLGLLDVIGLNRYAGWYSHTAKLEEAKSVIMSDLNTTFQRWGRPVFVSEFGADTVPGLHSTNELGTYTEEYQVAFLQAYHEVFDQLRDKFLIGEMVWNFADFATEQSLGRVNGMNYKGVFTRNRVPKAAAYVLRKRYGELAQGQTQQGALQLPQEWLLGSA